MKPATMPDTDTLDLEGGEEVSMSYIAIAECGHIVAAMSCKVEHASAKEWGKETAREIGKWLRSGLTVDRVPSSDVRTGKWCGNDCPRVEK
jgi:hypothetical protein